MLAAVLGVIAVGLWLAAVSAPARRTGALMGRLLDPGVSIELAAARARAVRGLSYELAFEIPDAAGEPVRGLARIRFDLAEIPPSLILDFAQPSDRILSVRVADRPSSFEVLNGHLLLPSSALRAERNEVVVEFLAGDEALNRNADFLYTLFVPARAHLTFPCFDQPDLKARYSLRLELPEAWEAVANGAAVERHATGARASILFAETPPLPTYLFAFAAGRFQIDRAERNGRTFRMLHRETDAPRVARNRDALFDLHAAALAWLEEYTGIPYPFGKFDFVLVPSFQFSGMEHAGAVFYNASILLLDQTATQAQQLARASTIAHESAHMWFGDLVTMRWFDDVWMKEVFASFLAAKIANPAFPELDHDLRFLMTNYPAAYEIDRTDGANPIRQRLDNLRDAGSLYGAIIYQKAPIVMRQLEAIVGQETFREGLREYLSRYAFGNATWSDLIRILDQRTGEDLAAWSRVWIEEPGRPTIRTELASEAGRLTRLSFTQTDPRARGLLWRERLQVVMGGDRGLLSVPVDLDGPSVSVAAVVGRPVPRFVLASGGGLGYGRFELDAASRQALVADLPDVPDALTRGSAWVTLWDELLEGRLAAEDFMDLALRALAVENDELNIQRVLAYTGTAFWRLLGPDARLILAPRLEAALQAGLAGARVTSLKAAFFSTLRDVALTPDAVAFLERVWRRQQSIPGLMLEENDESALAVELAVREVEASAAILREQLGRIQNPDRRARFAFVVPALSPDEEVRDRFFASLAEVANRRHEPWVLDAVAALHHPLRAADAERYLRPSLDLLEEIQRTGDIFFPKRWLDATLGGHQSPRAAAVVRQFLAAHPGYPPRLRQIILQSADLLFRASASAGG